MPTSHHVQAATRNQPSLLRVFQTVRDEGISVENGRLSDAVLDVARIFAVAGLLVTASGCLATRAWVADQLRPITGRQERFETQLNNLHLERRLVLDSSKGPTFAFGSAALTGNDKREIDGFLEDLEGSPNSGSAASERVFVVAGYTDSVGHEALQLRPRTAARYERRRISGRQEGPRPDAGSRGFLRREQAGRRQQHTERAAKQPPGRNSRLPREDRYKRPFSTLMPSSRTG